MKARDALLLNNTITQNPILARRPWFGMLHLGNSTLEHDSLHHVYKIKHD